MASEQGEPPASTSSNLSDGLPRAILDNMPNPVLVTDQDGQWVWVNPAFERFIGAPSKALIEDNLQNALPDTVRNGLHTGDDEIWQTRQPQISEVLMHDAHGEPHAIAIHKRILEIDGTSLLLHIFRDCTPEKKLQRRLLQLQTRFRAREETIHEQEQELRERATPVLEIGQGIVAVPLSGRLDAFRLHDLTHDVLNAIQRLGAHHLLLDLTGVQHADKVIADHLIKIVRAARLLGSNCALCSVHPMLANFFRSNPAQPFIPCACTSIYVTRSPS